MEREPERLVFDPIGQTYEIEERDLIDEIEERAARYDLEKALTDSKNEYWNKYEFVNLPLATEDSVYLKDMTVTVKENIITEDGKLILEKGSKFNPFDLMPFNRRVIVINATIPDHIKLAAVFVQMTMTDNLIPIVVTSAIDRSKGFDFLPNMSSKIGVKVGLLQPDLANKFELKKVPAIISASNKKGYMNIEYVQCNSVSCPSIEGFDFSE